MIKVLRLTVEINIDLCRPQIRIRCQPLRTWRQLTIGARRHKELESRFAHWRTMRAASRRVAIPEIATGQAPIQFTEVERESENEYEKS